MERLTCGGSSSLEPIKYSITELYDGVGREGVYKHSMPDAKQFTAYSRIVVIDSPSKAARAVLFVSTKRVVPAAPESTPRWVLTDEKFYCDIR